MEIAKYTDDSSPMQIVMNKRAAVVNAGVCIARPYFVIALKRTERSRKMFDEVLRLENITKIYGNGIMANNNVNFAVQKGEIHALMGENGAGKSTLMNVLFGIETPDEGKIFLNGSEVKITNPSVALGLGIGMVHQHFMLVPSLTVAENIILGSEPKKGLFINMGEAIVKTKAIAEKYNFKLDPKARISDLPVGMKQRVEILKALYRGAQILILDEPTAVLAPQETEELFKQLLALREQGHTIIFISHKIREVLEICDRITIMRHGRHVGVHTLNGDDGGNFTAEDISRLMVGRDVVLEVNKQPAKPNSKVLEVRDVSYIDSYNKIHVNHVNFDIHSGEILGVAGVEGNGQRELVEMITGLREIEIGDILLGGKTLRHNSIRQIRERKLAHIPQDRLTYGVAAGCTIEDNLILSLANQKAFHRGPLMNRPKLHRLSKKVVAEFGVKCESPEQYVGMLSGGNMQKVVVARELSDDIANLPTLIVADQPSRGIDIGATKFIHRKMIELRDRGSAVMLISADLNEVMELSDSLVVMYAGEIVAYFKDVKNLSEEELGRYMLGIKRQSGKEMEGMHLESGAQ